MTAAILQFNSHIQSATQSTQHTTHDQSDYIETPMNKEYHEIMIGLLDKEHPFKAIRLATQFNEANRFELISNAQIKMWKMKLLNGK